MGCGGLALLGTVSPVGSHMSKRLARPQQQQQVGQPVGSPRSPVCGPRPPLLVHNLKERGEMGSAGSRGGVLF